MSHILAALSVEVTATGPEPSPGQVIEALALLLKRDVVYVSVDLPDNGFASSRISVRSSQGTALVKSRMASEAG